MTSTTFLTVLLAGATGLIGSHLLRVVQADARVQCVIAPTRQALAGAATDTRVLNRVGPLPETLAALDQQVDIACCCIGTTIRIAGSREAFQAVDMDLPVAVGARALALGARHYIVVSALGADAESAVFYNRVKGEMESALRRQGWPRLTFVRPSLLLGERREQRLGERLAAPLMRLAPLRWRAIPAEQVARAMWHAAARDTPGLAVLESADLWAAR